LDFFYAVPNGSSKGTLYRAAPGTPGRAGRSPNRHMDNCAPEERTSQLPGKKTQANPNYVSPYTKEVMQSDIPLKTVLNKAAKLRNSPRKKRRAAKEARKTSRSRSKGRNRSNSGRSRSRKSLSRSGSQRQLTLSAINVMEQPVGKKPTRSMNTTAASFKSAKNVMPLKKLTNHLSARRQKLDSKYLAGV
jgi:hypothetical protein